MPVQVSGPYESATHFAMEADGVRRRAFYGILRVDWHNDELIPVVSMPADTAVNAIVGAELPLLRAPSDALLAQSVVARSFLLGTRAPRHAEAFFCDTTHCQFLRSPAPPGTAVARATDQTRGLVLSVDGVAFPAGYSAACGGSTEGGERDGHRYQTVACSICREQHLARRGHGWGLCQEGAMGLAKRGMNWREILAQYFPGAKLRLV